MRERKTPPAKCLFGLLLGLGMVGIIGGGCTDETLGEIPPEAGLYFPINMTSSNNQFVYVLNSNFDQRFNSGWLSVLDLAGENGGKLHSREEGGQLRVLSLGGDLAVDNPDDPSKLVISHRGSGTLSLVDISGGESQSNPVISCGDAGSTQDLTSAESLTDCDKSHLFRMTSAVSLASSNLRSENVRDPYVVKFYKDEDQLKLAVGFVSLEYLFFLDVEDDSSEGWFSDASGYDLGAGTSAGIESLAVLPGHSDYLVGTASQRSYVYTIGLKAKEDASQGEYQRFSMGTAAAGSDLVDIVFSNSADGDRTFAYVAVNNPGSIALLEITMASRLLLKPDGSYERVDEPEVHLLDILSIKGRPSGLSLGTGAEGDRLFVANFESDEVAVVARQGESLMVERILGPTEGIGHGPYSVLAVDCSLWGGIGCQRLVVANFFEHSISILDITSANAAEFTKLSVITNESVE